MTFVRANPPGWALFELLLSSQMNTIDSQMPFALDGRDGGTYVPSAAVVLDGTASAGHALEIISGPNGGLSVDVNGGPAGIQVDLQAGALAVDLLSTSPAGGILLRAQPGAINNAAITPPNTVIINGGNNTDADSNGGLALEVNGGNPAAGTGIAGGGIQVLGGTGSDTGGFGITVTGGVGAIAGGVGLIVTGGGGFVGGHGIQAVGGGGLGGGAGVHATGADGVGGGIGVQAFGGPTNGGAAFDGTGGPGSAGANLIGGSGSAGLTVLAGSGGTGAVITGIGAGVGLDVNAGASAPGDVAIDTNGAINFNNGDSAARNPAASVAMLNKLHAKNVVKAWGFIEDGVLQEGFNIASVAIDGVDNTYLLVTFAQAMANTDYVVISGPTRGFAGNNPRWQAFNFGSAGAATPPTVSAFQFNQVGNSGTVPFPANAQTDSHIHFVVLGEQ